MKSNNIVFMYHDVYRLDINESGFHRERDLPYKLSVAQFEQQVKAIQNYCRESGLNTETVVFTFDDGGKSSSKVIAPILERYGYKGIFFISTKYIDTETFLSQEEIVNLHKRGHIIGSHAHSHEHLYTLTDDQVKEEWMKSVKILSNIIDTPIKYASIPNGDMSNRVLDAVSDVGIDRVYTSEPTTKIGKYKDMAVVGRYVIMADDTTEQVISIVSSDITRFILSCKRKALKVTKTLLGGSYIKLKNKFYMR